MSDEIELPSLQENAEAQAPAGDLERLESVSVEVAVEIGRTNMTLGGALALAPGSIVTLDRAADQPVDLLVNGRPIARGEVIVVDEEFGLRVTEIIRPDQGAVLDLTGRQLAVGPHERVAERVGLGLRGGAAALRDPQCGGEHLAERARADPGRPRGRSRRAAGHPTISACGTPEQGLQAGEHPDDEARVALRRGEALAQRLRAGARRPESRGGARRGR